ncbi:hypothetical protein F3Y22_tig00110015pilonHSYRG00165 [Hibiscus syriacus]|uniref:RRM domain-containing protein n=1 Tax=Hibiscus syriacus TaxID=106335 RepID=A0A6A3BSE4_HIBSY|nr:hypothetical protein F3Y22_tig00110015pilonHSYRG00165 [Hibiscus syriacus]
MLCSIQAVSKEKLEGEFRKFGKIEDFMFLGDRNTAFVEYSSMEDASEAMRNMSGKRIGKMESQNDTGIAFLLELASSSHANIFLFLKLVDPVLHSLINGLIIMTSEMGLFLEGWRLLTAILLQKEL